jgi:NAD(P)-dependent dehydrogenase (short-subunit alcohol dehydrogenase family)
MAWTANDIPDQTGRVAVVTGANGGLGLETARALAGAGAHVVMAARNQDKAAAAADDIRTSHPDAALEIVALDLGSQEQTKGAADAIVAAHPTIDVLVNNAGVMAIPRTLTADGHEMQFGVNHLGHWTFTARLLPSLRAAGDARVVTVTSTAHHVGRAVDPDDVEMEKGYGDWKAYGRSKLANWQFGIGLDRRLRAEGWPVESLIAHPGLSDTDLQATSVENSDGKFLAKMFHSMASSTGMSAARGALPQLRAATDPSAAGGEFYGPRWMNTGHPVRLPILRRVGMDRAIETLWAVSEDLTGETILPG